MKALPNTCAPTAVITAECLRFAGISAHVLRVRWVEKSEPTIHVLALFSYAGKVRAYDYRGTIDLPKTLTLGNKPIELGRAWHKASGEAGKIVQAEWY